MVADSTTSQGRPWDYDGLEIVADGVVHALGILLAVVGSIALLGFVLGTAEAGRTVSHAVYCATLLITLGASATYNMWPISPLKWRLRRLDHAMIFALIAGTYTPFLARIDSTQTWALLATIWTVSVAGMVMKLFAIGRREWLATCLYLMLGWSGVVTLGAISGSMPQASLILLVGGGLLYSGGVVFHHWRSLRFQNAIWHTFVLGGAVCHFAAVLIAIRPHGA